MAELAIPPPQGNDSEDVHWALSTAASLWASGAREDALRWLRRAAEAANDRDDEVRALQLFRAAAEIRESIPPGGGATVTPTPASGAKPKSVTPPPTATVSRRPPPRPSKPPPLPPGRLQTLPPAKSVAKTEAAPPSTARPTSGAAQKASLQSVRPLPKPVPPPRDAVRAEQTQPSVQRTESGQRPAISQHAAPAVLPALRLAILPVGPNGELRVTLLGQDEPAPPGAVSGIFVPTSDTDAAALLARVSKARSR